MKDSRAREIVETLRGAGHQAYFVGGCVRDLVMGVEPADYDIATSARPDQVRGIFPRTQSIGARFGVVRVIFKGGLYEVATFRSDAAYVDGRRPTSVTFTGPEDDVRRRDFTINGLLYDPVSDTFIDHVNGRADIERKIVRAIGDPAARFEEDKLRILRAIRFGARPGYRIEPDTWDAVRRMAPMIHQVSRERIRDELVRLLSEGQARRGFQLLAESGLFSEILPEVTWGAHLDACLGLMGPEPKADFAMAVLLHECPPAAARGAAERLRLSRRQVDHVESLVRMRPALDEVERMPVSAVKRLLRRHRFEDHLELHRIHAVAAGLPTAAYAFIRERRAAWSDEDLSPEPLISGADLISLGIEPGPPFAKILTAVEDEQLEGRLSTRASALAFVRERFP